MPKFIVKDLKNQEEQDYELSQESIVFGRTNTCDIELPGKIVSRRHAEIIQEEENYFLSDLRSGNGTFLNQKKLRPEEKYLLRSGDVIKIEDYEVHFLLSDIQQALPFEEVTDTDILEIKLLKKMMKALDRQGIPSIEILNGPSAGLKTSFPEEQEAFTIGRGEKCDISVPDHSLSRVHAKFEHKWGGIVLSDAESKNGIFVNGEKVHEKLLKDGDRLILGNLKLLYRNPKEVDLQMAHQELARKKKAAALEEAELLAKQQKEELRIADQNAALLAAEQAVQAAEIEASLEAPSPDQTEEAPATNPEAKNELSTNTSALEKPKYSLLEKIMIASGIAVGIVAIGGLLVVLLK